MHSTSFRLRFVNSSKTPDKTCVVIFFLAKTMICEVAQVLFICYSLTVSLLHVSFGPFCHGSKDVCDMVCKKVHSRFG